MSIHSLSQPTLSCLSRNSYRYSMYNQQRGIKISRAHATNTQRNRHFIHAKCLQSYPIEQHIVGVNISSQHVIITFSTMHGCANCSPTTTSLKTIALLYKQLISLATMLALTINTNFILIFVWQHFTRRQNGTMDLYLFLYPRPLLSVPLSLSFVSFIISYHKPICTVSYSNSMSNPR